MKLVRKTASLLLALVMVFAMTATAFAQEVTVTGGGKGSITISNAAKGETYTIYKLFDATVSPDGQHIAYTGSIPASLAAYFTADTNGYISATAAAKEGEAMSAGLNAALKTWAQTATAAASAQSDGSALCFKGLDYGYYVITTTQGQSAISVDSTMPDVTVVDKNSEPPTASKTVDDPDVAIGQRVTYTATFNTANFIGAGTAAERVYKYVITDTLPAFLADVEVTSLTIGGTAYTVGGKAPQFDSNKSISIPWVDANGNSLYANGADIVLTYEATVTDQAEIDGTTGNVNTVTLKPYKDNEKPFEREYSSKKEIFTYAAALKKVDEDGAALAGAKFAAKGLTVSGAEGNYTVVSYDPTSTTNGTVMECDSYGNLVIKGLPSDAKLVLTETEAPAGYNKLTTTVELPAHKIGEVVTVSSTKIYYDAEGNVTEEVTNNYTTSVTYNEDLAAVALVIENKSGTELPSTGGMGTTIFYILGSVLALGAAVLLITKKRMSMNGR